MSALEETSLPDRALSPIADGANQSHVRREIESLRRHNALLATQGGLEAFLATADTIPAVLHDIGRLREICFRAVGEGTGRPLDLDRFDHTYLHVFLWDSSRHRVAGAYRLGPTDLLLAEYGPSGLYCSTLFDFEQPFLDHLTPGLELGRSFIAGDYQRSMGALHALWKGVGRFVARAPRYARLFGPVSISKTYTPISRNLMVGFLREKRKDPSLSALVRPTRPFEPELPGGISPRLEDIKQVSARVSEVEPDGKGVPVLLRHYLKLNATLLEFNVDPQFSNCLDALLMVDLRRAPAAMVRRYLGPDAARLLRTEAGSSPSP